MRSDDFSCFSELCNVTSQIVIDRNDRSDPLVVAHYYRKAVAACQNRIFHIFPIDEPNGRDLAIHRMGMISAAYVVQYG